jgi:hypothetical protein
VALGNTQLGEGRIRLAVASGLAVLAHAAAGVLLGSRHPPRPAPALVSGASLGDFAVELQDPDPTLQGLGTRGVGPEAARPGRRPTREPGAPRPARASAAVSEPHSSASIAAVVVGQHESFAGGFTTSQGTADIFVGDPTAADALLYGDGSGGGPDLSAPPRLGGYVYWNCPWPGASPDVEHAVAHVTADVNARGEPTGAQLIDDSGRGFGAHALACALQEHYLAGRDRLGRPAAGRTRPFAVRFDRGWFPSR